MKGLIIKDLCTITKQLKILIFFVVIFSMVPGFSMVTYVIIYMSMLPMTAMAYDERSKWNELARMMPYSDTTVVFSKYILGYIAIAFAAVLSVAAQSVIGIIRHEYIGTENLIMVAATVAIAILIQALSLPFMFRFGVEKGRMLLILMTMAVIIIGMTLSEVLLSASVVGTFAKYAVLIAIVATVAISALSVFLSVKLYRKNRA